jgi:hypothetical protein
MERIAMTSHLVRAFDRRKMDRARNAYALDSAVQACRHAPHLVLARKELTILAALDWAFGAERASLDFLEGKGDNARPGVSPLWTVMQRGALGCQIDGGGWNPPAADADIIASAVAHLPAALGGPRMALRIAELARAGLQEDWGADLKPRCIPSAWKGENQHGPQAETVVVRQERILKRGRISAFEVRACPVTYTADPARIAGARKAWTRWRVALEHLRDVLVGQGTLDRLRITDGLPEAEPWVRSGSDAKSI